MRALPHPAARTLRWLLLGLLALAALLGAIAVVDRTMRARALVAEEEAGRDNAAILAESLRSELDKFSLLPMALAQDPQVRSLLGGAAGEAQPLNLRLEELARQSGAAAFYAMDAQGMTLAASNWDRPESFVGSDYAFRRYFREAMANGSATQFALGTVSRKPGLYIAERVGPADAPLGVVALKVEFDSTEANWRQARQGVYVTDAAGVVLITSEEAYRFHLVPGADPAGRDPELDLRQFGMAQLPMLEIAGQDAVELPLVDAQ
ncbi:MAG: hypothetical protein KDE15_10240, partial [Erythrobacter sp.]|nr:hypothetical protein [Erythrobacter sp.]